MNNKSITRREMLRNTALLAIGSSIAIDSKIVWGNSPESKSRVILIRDKNLLDNAGKLDATVIKSMLDMAVTRLLEETSPDNAWRKIVKPSDVVGIKTNVWKSLATPESLEQAIKSRVMEVGVKPEDISINDRGVLNDPVFKRATVLINSRPMRAHAWSGVGTLLKNYIMFTPKPSDYHPDSCADLAKLWELPEVKGKTRLNILVMITPQFHGIGPHSFSAEYIWPYNGLIVSLDPVAADSVGLRIIEAKRKIYFGDDRPLNPPAKHIELADTRHHIGNANPAKIELIRLGWEENILI